VSAYHPTFVSGLHDLDCFQGKNISSEPRYAEEATKGAPLVNVSRPHGEIT
jgi:hypothetical protein